MNPEAIKDGQAFPGKRTAGMIKVWIFILVVISVHPLGSFAQDVLPNGAGPKSLSLFHDALKEFDQGNNEKCLKLISKAIKISPGFANAHILRGDCYLELDSAQQAAASYLTAVELVPEKPAIAINLLANTLFKLHRYHEAATWYDSLLRFPLGEDIRQIISHKLKLSEFREHAISLPVEFQPINLGPSVNTGEEEYVNALSADGRTIIFTRRSRNTGTNATSSKQFREDFYQSFIQDSTWSPASLLGYPATTEGDAGGLCYSPDGRTMFFTACFRPDSKGSCDIYYSEKSGDEWSAPRNLGDEVNSDLWDSQPSISPDGNTLYFASNREGCYGGSDIWKTVKNAKGEWTRPVNLGKSVNTSESEMSPFIHYDNQTLYFASSGHMGMGGADLYKSSKTATGWSTPENLGYPLNSAADELIIIVDPSGITGYISADSLEGFGKFDIYRLRMPVAGRPVAVTYLKGIVTDAESGSPLDAVFELIDIARDSLVVRSVSDKARGDFLFCLPTGRDYALNVTRTGYLFHSEHFAMNGIHGKLDPFLLDIRLQKIRVGEVTVLKNVFFDTDRYDLKVESRAELGKLVEFLEKNPLLGIEIGGHTDNVGTMEYNDDLSVMRARSVYLFLLENGIETGRISYKGYGFNVPLAGNDTEEGRALNRRTEMKIISLSSGQ